MKIKLLLALVVMSLFSCSSDDTSMVKKLDMIKTTFYNAFSGTETGYGVHEFDNRDRVATYKQYDADEVLLITMEYTYGQFGPDEIKTFDGDNFTSPSSIATFNYDGDGRLLKHETIAYVWGQTISSGQTYVYNEDNSITATDKDGAVKTYYKNKSGRINKIVSADDTQRVSYEGDNMETSDGNGKSYNYTYDPVYEPKGNAHKIMACVFNGNQQNAILFAGFGVMELGVSRLVAARYDLDGLDNIEYEYEYAGGYPSVCSEYHNKAANPLVKREIFYK